MRAVRIHRFGGPDVMTLDVVNEPRPMAGEVVIKVFAASVNPVDAKMREGRYPAVAQNDLPYVLGRDVCGEIVELGDEVSSFLVGDKVFVFLSPQNGGYADFVVAKTNEIAMKPKTLDPVDAAAVPLAAMTAWQGLFDNGRLAAGQRVLVHGGAGGVGHLAVQFAKAKGAWVATTVSATDRAFIRDLGADVAIDYKTERFEDLLEPVDLVFDLIAGETQDRSFAIVKPGGALISTLQEPDAERAREAGIRVGRFTAQPSGLQLEEIARLIDAGKVKVVVRDVFELEDAAKAQVVLEKEHGHGKVVLKVL